MSKEVSNYSVEEIKIIKDQIAKDCTDLELGLFIQVCKKSGLDPFTRQIYAIKRKSYNADKRGYDSKMSIQTSIDGFRLIAQRSGEYEGQSGPYWCGEDGKWTDIWLKTNSPFACKIGVYRSRFKEALYGIAKFESYAQKNQQGELSGMWKKMPELMISKCAEALALRKAFPNELSGLYTSDEITDLEVSSPPSKEPLLISIRPFIGIDQIKTIQELADQANWPMTAVTSYIKNNFRKESRDMLEEEYQKLCFALNIQIEENKSKEIHQLK